MQGQKKLGELEARYDQLTQDMADPAVMADQDRYQKAGKAAAEIARRSSTSIGSGNGCSPN